MKQESAANADARLRLKMKCDVVSLQNAHDAAANWGYAAWVKPTAAA